MKITYFGTAAAEGIPALFCSCDVCKQARENKGKDFRTRSQSMIDDQLLIDFPQDTYMHVLQHGLPLHTIKHCIITHAHADHLYPEDLHTAAPAYAPVKESDEPFTIYGSRAISKAIAHVMFLFDMERTGSITHRQIMPFNTYEIAGYKVTPLAARHDALSGPYVYIIEKNGERIFYCNDTGDLPEESWKYLESNPQILDYVSLDCTEGIKDISYDAHMNYDLNKYVKERLTKIGCADDKTVFCLNHFSHNGGSILHNELSKAVAKDGFMVSYDGMVYDISAKKIIK